MAVALARCLWLVAFFSPVESGVFSGVCVKANVRFGGDVFPPLSLLASLAMAAGVSSCLVVALCAAHAEVNPFAGNNWENNGRHG